MRIALLADPHLSLLPEDRHGRMFTRSRATVRATIDQVNEQRPDLAFWLGDLTHEGTQAVRDAFAEELRRLSMPSLQIIGNHDVEVPTKAEFAETIHVVRRGVFQWAGWVVAVLDPVRELSPELHDGLFTDADLATMHDAIGLAAGGPVLMLSHQPPRENNCTNYRALFDATRGHPGVLVSIAGHTHMNRYEQRGAWHLIERSSLILYPLEWHLLELSPASLSLRTVAAPVGELRDEARAALIEHAGDGAAETYRGEPAAREIHIVAAQKNRRA